MRIIPFLPLMLLLACPDPNASSSGSEATSDQTTSNGSQETDPSSARLDCTKDKPDCLEVSGTMTFAGEAKGTYRIDVKKHREGSMPSLAHVVQNIQPDGKFSFYIPKDYGKITLEAFIDLTMDGPTEEDPQSRTNLEIKDEAITELTIEVFADNARVQPKPPSDTPNDASQNNEEKKNDTTTTEPEKKEEKTDGPPADDNNGPPADE